MRKVANRIVIIVASTLVFGLIVQAVPEQISSSARFNVGGRQTIFNTGNAFKKAEITKVFRSFGSSTPDFSNIEMREILADAKTVAIHKASTFNEPGKLIVVEDSSLEVEGANIGVNVKHLISQLPSLTGRRAVWKVIFAARAGQVVLVTEAEIRGRIVHKRGEEPGFGPFFQPDGADRSLALLGNPPEFSARARALKLWVRSWFEVYRPIENWQGQWQQASAFTLDKVKGLRRNPANLTVDHFLLGPIDFSLYEDIFARCRRHSTCLRGHFGTQGGWKARCCQACRTL